ncbi:hypothetical protein [Amycolatopsis sp. NPDC059021]|uniref:hypothetical protein n=1 Tax=Amycolatopsis sp. NPDC059021 TaxID=3346704 RepID=UPI00366C56DF
MDSTNDVRPPAKVAWELFEKAVDRAMATGYSYGRIDARWEKRGPLIHTDVFLAAVESRGVGVGGFRNLFEQLETEATAATEGEAA